MAEASVGPACTWMQSRDRSAKKVRRLGLLAIDREHAGEVSRDLNPL